jgi:lipopolysaccharide/colanic/teichoic acid biosynthesis glycosyltransferase
MKRAMDILVSAVALALLSPVLLAVALLVRIGIGSPVLFRQRRGGYRGRPFEVVKFRTMSDKRDGNGTLLPDAQRMTALGSVLRATSLDELPQLWNVLRGDMSLVGPRPLTFDYISRYSPRQARRHDVRPGITGWAQVNGRNQLTWPERFEYDLWYVEHQSLALDLKILFMTLLRVFRREGISTEGEATSPEFTGNEPPA